MGTWRKSMKLLQDLQRIAQKMAAIALWPSIRKRPEITPEQGQQLLMQMMTGQGGEQGSSPTNLGIREIEPTEEEEEVEQQTEDIDVEQNEEEETEEEQQKEEQKQTHGKGQIVVRIGPNGEREVVRVHKDGTETQLSLIHISEPTRPY